MSPIHTAYYQVHPISLGLLPSAMEIFPINYEQTLSDKEIGFSQFLKLYQERKIDSNMSLSEETK